MELRYIGKTGARRVNGRRMVNGAILSDPNEVRDLQGHPDFEVIGEEPREEVEGDGFAE
jgi:hypothetical protein